MCELDDVLEKIGDLGTFQITVFAMYAIAVILDSAIHNAFVFTALDVSYRCFIPECDIVDSSPLYAPAWLPAAVPFKNGAPDKCVHYQYNSTSKTTETPFRCSPADFDQDKKISCDSFIYETREWSILQEYQLQCDENLWKLTMVGTINGIGQFFGLFLGGVISDNFGRKFVLIWGMILCSVFGLIRTLMPTYEWFLVCEFLDAMFGAGTYICGFVLAVELVGPKKRVLTGIISSSSYALGEMFTAVSAWSVQSWKPLIYIIYSPSFLLISYIWLAPESVRWLLSKGRTEEVKAILRKAAKVNNRELSEDSLDKLVIPKLEEANVEDSILAAFKSRILAIRLIACSFCWIVCAFLFYGLTLNSVTLVAGNSYLDFMLTSLIEIPAYICCHFMLDLLGRRKSLSLSFLVTGLACATFVFIPSDSRSGSLAVYLIGKFGATLAFTNMYVHTSEMFPTKMRHTFMGFCSTVGRLGSIIAPQTPLLARIWNPLPLILFAGMAAVAAILSFIFPETSNIKLPDTIEEAENIPKLQQTSSKQVVS